MQGLDHTFESGLIERMELTVLKALDWRLICTTPFSYVELMTWNIIDLLAKPLLVDQLMDRLNGLLLGALLGKITSTSIPSNVHIYIYIYEYIALNVLINYTSFLYKLSC